MGSYDHIFVCKIKHVCVFILNYYTGEISKETSILGTKIMKATHTGNKFNQQNSINWSYLNLGKVALNQTNKKQKKHVFKPNIIDWILIRLIDWFPCILNSGKL